MVNCSRAPRDWEREYNHVGFDSNFASDQEDVTNVSVVTLQRRIALWYLFAAVSTGRGSLGREEMREPAPFAALDRPDGVFRGTTSQAPS